MLTTIFDRLRFLCLLRFLLLRSAILSPVVGNIVLVVFARYYLFGNIVVWSVWDRRRVCGYFAFFTLWVKRSGELQRALPVPDTVRVFAQSGGFRGSSSLDCCSPFHRLIPFRLILFLWRLWRPRVSGLFFLRWI